MNKLIFALIVLLASTFGATATQIIGPIVSLEIQAGAVLGSGLTSPLARQDIYLLSEDASEVVRPVIEDYKSEASIRKTAEVLVRHVRANQKIVPFVATFPALWCDPAAADNSTVRKAADRIRTVCYAFNRMIVAKITTDVWGNGRIANVRPGQYFVFCHGVIGPIQLAWSLPIDITENSKLILDNRNAAAIDSTSEV